MLGIIAFGRHNAKRQTNRGKPRQHGGLGDKGNGDRRTGLAQSTAQPPDPLAVRQETSQEASRIGNAADGDPAHALGQAEEVLLGACQGDDGDAASRPVPRFNEMKKNSLRPTTAEVADHQGKLGRCCRSGNHKLILLDAMPPAVQNSRASQTRRTLSG